MSHYETLGVTETANLDDIKKAFRRLASQHHPDKGGDTKQFQKIQEAYDVLNDTEKRQKYDLERRGFSDNGVRFNWNSNAVNIDDIFEHFGFQGRGPRAPKKNRDLRISINVSLRDTLESQTKTMMIRTSNNDETLNINVPRGITDGATIKYSGLGDNLFNTLPRGDLYVHFHVVPHPKFRPVDTDLLTKIEISCFDAIIGGESEIEGLDGKKFLITVPKGVQHGTKLRIKDQGLYNLQNGLRGNLLVEILITIPTNLNESMMNIIRQIRSDL